MKIHKPPKVFKTPAVPVDQLLLLPPNVADLVPEDGLARILSELVDRLDCRALVEPYKGGGPPAYDPVMMFKVLVFGCTEGIRSSRRLARALTYDVRFMYLARMSTPDFRTIARFRRTHEKAIAQLFAETVLLANQMGLVLLEFTAVDGTKLEAQGSRRNYRHSDELDADLARTKERIAQILSELEKADTLEEQQDNVSGDGNSNDSNGSNGNGSSGSLDDIPEELRTLQARKARLDELKAELQSQQETQRANDVKEVSALVTTDPDSRMMMTTNGIRPCFNAQMVVDGAAQIVMAADVTQQVTDSRQLKPMLDQLQDTIGRLPDQVAADAGYWSKTNLDYSQSQRLNAYIAPAGTKTDNMAGWKYIAERDVWLCPEGGEHLFLSTRERYGRTYRLYRKAGTKKPKWVNDDNEQMTRMRAKVASPDGKAAYKRRQVVVEPVFGHIKGSYGLRRLLLRGKSGAKIEFLLACIAHNLGKIATFVRATTLAPALAKAN